MAEPTTPVPLRTVRTFTPRYRLSRLTQERLDRLLPRYAVSSLPIRPADAFGRDAPLVLEIGSGHGAAAIGYARAHPSHNILTAEVHLPGVARMLAAAELVGVSNLRAYCDDAMDLLEGGLAPGSVAAVHILFPDPWPKRKHAKRRLIQVANLDAIAALLAPGGSLLFGTDHPVYAEHARQVLAEHGGFAVTDVARPSWKDADGFEGKGLGAGRSITYLRAVPVPAT